MTAGLIITFLAALYILLDFFGQGDLFSNLQNRLPYFYALNEMFDIIKMRKFNFAQKRHFCATCKLVKSPGDMQESWNLRIL